MLPLHLRTGAREWTFGWLARERPDLVERYQALYGRGAYVPGWYARRLAGRVRPLLAAHGLDHAPSSHPGTGDRAEVSEAAAMEAPAPLPLFG